MEQRGLPRTVPPGDADNFPRLATERNVLQRPELLRRFQKMITAGTEPSWN
jgi:hypothetical protein